MGNTRDVVITPVMPKVLSNEQVNVYVPFATEDTVGISKFYKDHFIIVDGVVKINPEYAKTVLEANFQPRYDDKFRTKDKTVVGATNELLEDINKLNSNIDDTLAKNIRFVKYRAEDAKITPSLVETVPSVNEQFIINGAIEYFNKDDEYKGDFSVKGLTAYLEDYIDDSEKLFFAVRREIKPSQYGGEIGFKITLAEETFVQILQLYLWGIYQDLTLTVASSTDGVMWNEQNISFKAQPGSYLNVYRVRINEDCKYVKVVQKGTGSASYRYIVKGVELFASTTDGHYDIVQRNGVTSTLDTFDAKYLKDTVDTGLNNIEQASDVVNGFLQDIDKANGFPQLDENGQIKASQIPRTVAVDILDRVLVDEYFTEASVESRLIAVTRSKQANHGDLVVFERYEDIPSLENENETIKTRVAIRTYMFVGGGTNDLNIDELSDTEILTLWTVQGSNYSVYSEYSGNAKESENTSKVDGVLFRVRSLTDFNKEPVKNGVFIITDYSE